MKHMRNKFLIFVFISLLLVIFLSCDIEQAEIYTVTFDAQEGTVSDPTTKEVISGEAYRDLAITTREGYIFEGWWTGEEGAGTEIVPTTHVSITSDQTLYAKWRAPKVKELGEAGGYVFFDKGAYNTEYGTWDGTTWTKEGYGDEVWRYLEAAPARWSGIEIEPDYPLGFYRTTDDGVNSVVGTGTGIGTGKANTVTLTTAMGSEAYTKASKPTKGMYAAKVCGDFDVTIGGVTYADWFLPSKDELDQMYKNLKDPGLGGFSDDTYWSSSENDANYAWGQMFDSGAQGNLGFRETSFKVRPVRAF